VWTEDGLRVFESNPHPVLPARAVLGFSNVSANGTTYRVYSLQAGSRVIQVAQDLSSRRIAAGTLALRTVIPVLLTAPLLMFVAAWVVRRSLAPVAVVRRQIAARQPGDLSELRAVGVPDEILPLVNELNLLFARVQRAFQAQQHFVADAAHELRSPLAALKLQVQRLQRSGDESARSVATERLAAGIDRATRLVEQLLVLARQEARATADEPRERVSLSGVARSIVTELAPAARERAIDLGLLESDATAVIDGYADALHILIRNLVDNAIRYTPEHGAIDVEVCSREGGVWVAVEDSGPGIPPDERGRVLERFHRGRDVNAPGSGLGLAIAQAIAHLHNGQLELTKSERRGGLRAVVRFPPERPAAGATPD